MERRGLGEGSSSRVRGGSYAGRTFPGPQAGLLAWLGSAGDALEGDGPERQHGQKMSQRGWICCLTHSPASQFFLWMRPKEFVSLFLHSKLERVCLPLSIFLLFPSVLSEDRFLEVMGSSRPDWNCRSPERWEIGPQLQQQLQRTWKWTGGCGMGKHLFRWNTKPGGGFHGSTSP